jgi:hypothetical protein
MFDTIDTFLTISTPSLYFVLAWGPILGNCGFFYNQMRFIQFTQQNSAISVLQT